MESCSMARRFSQPKMLCMQREYPRLVKHAREVLPLLPLALATWSTDCCGVKVKLLRPRKEIECLGCWRNEVLSAALCQQHALLSINQEVFLFIATQPSLCICPLMVLQETSTIFCTPQPLAGPEGTPAAAAKQLQSPAAAPQHWGLGVQRKSRWQIHSHACPGPCKTHPVGKWGTVVAVAEQGQAGVYTRTQISASLQHADHLVLQLVGTNVMAEISPDANITGLACLLCVHVPIIEIPSSRKAGSARGGAATCYGAILAAAAAACPLCCSGLQDAEDAAFLPPGLLLQLGGWQREVLGCPGGSRYVLENRRNGKIRPLPNVLIIWVLNCH